MPQITLLSEETIDKIAAGEVIERPSSVVKELVENAIDAGAGAVAVEIRDGGTTYIRVTDNGCGIEREQVPMAFLRHSTSKIRQAEDLPGVRTLGFRGEALSSIAAVSKVEMVTKPSGALTGTRYVIEGAREEVIEEVGAPDGTTIIVRGLFYNTPARQKFLKTPQTEGSYVAGLMERLALSRPDVSFKFVSNGQARLQTAGNSSGRDLLFQVYGRDIAEAAIPVSYDSPLFSLRGFIGKPVVARGNRGMEHFFANGRYVRSALFSKALEEAYHGFLMQRQFPMCVLYLSFEGGELDVNVHPSKMEVRVSRGEDVYRELCGAARAALSGTELIPEVPLGRPSPSKKKKEVAAGKDAPEPFERAEGRAVNEPGAAGEGLRVFDELLAGDAAGPGTLQSAAGAPQGAFEQESQAAGASQGAFEQESLFREDGIAALGGGAKNAATGSGGFLGGIKDGDFADSGSGGDARPRFLSREAAREHRIIGQVFDTYWIVEYGESVFFIDQHAAHEKVLYERTMARLREGSFSSQALSPPVILTLSAKEREALGILKEPIEALGYAIEHFGGMEYAIRGVPAEFETIDAGQMLIGLLDDPLILDGRIEPEEMLEKVASMSCKAAVKGGSRLTYDEARELIGELLSLENPYHCPHGRPTIISMTRQELEKKFKRIV